MNLELRTLDRPNWELFDLFNHRAEHWNPTVEITEDENFFSLAFDVPGIKKENIDLEVKENRLYITGERKADKEKEKVLRSERRYGKFSRIFTLPQDVNTDAIEARFEEGVLTVVLPKVEKPRPKKISISTPVSQ